MSSTEALPVLHADPWLVAVRKPAGLPVQADRTGDPDLLAAVRAQFPQRRLELAHRIDRPVSGVVLLAEAGGAIAAMHALFRARRVRKAYWAIAEGRPEAPGPLLLEHRLAHDPRSRRARVEAAPGGAPERMEVRVLAQGERYALLECVPEGGAFHQVRAQLAAWGHPIKGDVKYGARRGEKDRSIALHARELRFTHPSTGQVLRILAEPPQAPPWPALLAAAGVGAGDRSGNEGPQAGSAQ